jgi:DGQHR domain-containing protein
MPKIITRPAALVTQGNLKLYTTSLRVADLLIDNFYDIERLDPENPDDKGYQRVLNKSRAKKLADYLIDGQDNHDAFLPTSLFLATDKNISFDPALNTITFDVEQICPFSVVDGQHRIEGLRLAAAKKGDMLSFEVPVNIAVNLPKIAQMCHFLIVNTTQKSVDRAVEQRIFARLTDAFEIEDVPSLPKWIQRIVESGDDKQALKIVDYLNEAPDSPWLGKIEMGNQDTKAATINQKSFVKAIKKYVLTANNPISVRDPDQQQKIFFNYWKAIANLLDAGKPTVLFKYNGVELFCRFSVPVFNKLQNINNFKIATIEQLLRDTFDNLEGEAVGVGHSDWWLSGSGLAGGMNSTALGKVNHELTKALQKIQASSGDIQL